MKKSFLGIACLVAIMWMTACQNQNEVSPTLSEGIIESINPTELPLPVQSAVANDYMSQSVTAAEKVTGSEGSISYDVVVDSGESASYTPEGNKCNRVTLAEIPQTIQDYVTTNYAEASIKRAFQRTAKDGSTKIIVKLDIRKALSFDEAGNFLGEKQGRKKRR